MIANLIALALIAAQAKVQLNVNVKDGEVVTGERVFRVLVTAKDPITQVEFYVGDELRETDTSTPYEFKIDSLAEKEGVLRMKFAAYTSKGDSASKAVRVSIDNLTSKGAKFHVDRARELLSLSKWDDAILATRIALKAQPGFAPAQVAMARAYLGKGVLDSAQKFAEDALVAEPNNLEAAELLAGINLQKAFATFNRGGDRRETLDVIKVALKSAVENRRKVLDYHFESLGAVTNDNRLRYADAAMRSSRYQSAINALTTEFAKDNRKTEVANRLAYAQLRAGRVEDAATTMADHKKFGTPDAYGFALIAIIEAQKGNWQASDDAMREAVLSEGDNMGVRTSQAYLALRRGGGATLKSIALQLAKDEGQRSEVHLYLTAFYNQDRQFELSRRHFERAVLAEPASYDVYIERANESIGMALSGSLPQKDKDLELEMAKILLDTALAARPESHEALTGVSVLSLHMGKRQDALLYAQAAVKAGPTYPAGHYALAAAYSALGNTSEASKANLKAGQLDKPNLEGRELPNARVAWQYFARHGRTPLITAPK